MKKRTIKTMAAVLAIATTTALVSINATAGALDDEMNFETVNTVCSNTDNAGGTDTDDAVKAGLSDEVVYVFTDKDGKVDKVMDSILIEEGNENGELSKEDLPVGIKMTYYLDGKEVTAGELDNAKGHIKIRCDYTPLKYEMKMIGGKNEKIYVPFGAALITAMDGDTFKNVTVSSGKVTLDGLRYAVVGVAFPGLKEDLDLDKVKNDISGTEDIDTDIPEYIEIEADTDCYKAPDIYMAVSNSIFNAIDVSAGDSLTDVDEAVTKITDAMNALTDGSSKLYDGLDELLKGVNTLSTGMNELTVGLDTLTSNNAALVKGSEDVFNSLLKQAQSGLEAAGLNVGTLTIDNYDEKLTGAINSLNGTDVYGTAQKEVESKVRANEAQVKDAVTEAVKEQVTDGVNKAVKAQVEAGVTEAVKENVRPMVKSAVDAGIEEQYGHTPGELIAAGMLTEEDYNETIDEKLSEQMESDAVRAQIDSNTEAQMNSDQIKALIESKINEQMASDQITSTIDSKTEEQIGVLVGQYMQSPEVTSKIDAGKAKVSEGVKEIEDLKGRLDSYRVFYNGINEYTNGVSKACEGAHELNNAMPDVIKAVSALKEGEGQVVDGLNKFNDEGISKITELLKNGLGNTIDRLNAVSEVSHSYTGYTESEEQKEGVKFIIKIG
ncbi:MAG: hypothetical protein J6S95_06285 [Lachnospiraceae bacterium]|nr:hypothetical protein [Lachnospiraceae bacterium]